MLFLHSVIKKVIKDGYNEGGNMFSLFKKKNVQMGLKDSTSGYTKQEYLEVEKYIEKNFGEIKYVIHEEVLDNLHIDIAVIPPNKKENYYKLITIGMGACKMKLPEELSNYHLEFSELVIFLPSEWNIKGEEEKWFWPIRWLRNMARLPFEENTWIGFGHTVDCQEPFADNTKLSAMLFLTPLDRRNHSAMVKLSNHRRIKFYQLCPIYHEEMEFCLKSSDIDDFIELLSDEDLRLIVNVDRKNYCQ